MDVLQLEDDFNEVLGRTVTTLFEVWGYDESQKGHRCRTALRGTLFRFDGYIPRESSVFLAIGAEVTKQGNALCLKLTSTGSLHGRPPMELKNITKVVETCSGIGCLGKGLSKAGFNVVLRNDFNAPILGVSQTLDSKPIVLGDITEDATLDQICRQVPYSCTTAAGVSCQPHSKLGDRQGSKDIRAATLPRTLKTAFLMRQLAIILECVEEVKQSDWAQSVIEAFAKATGYRVTQGTLHLQHVWPTRRSRWWCILTHKMLGKVPWLDFPIANPRPIVIDVLPEFKQCTNEELRQLRLDDYELGKFNSAGLTSNLIPTRGVMKTSLHSCGSQLSACPCGCRKFPFGEERLASRGLHGHLVALGDIVQTAVGPIPACRHIHPAELAIMNGMFCNFEWGPNLKLSLSGLGQLASPLQAVWVGSLLIQHCIQEGIIPGEIVHPKHTLLNVMGELLEDRDRYFGPPKSTNAKNFQTWVKQGLLFQQLPMTKPEVVHMPIPGKHHSNQQLEGSHWKQHVKPSIETDQQNQESQKQFLDEWVCDYKGCPVCQTEQLPPQENHDVLKPKDVREAEISPTLHFTAIPAEEIKSSLPDPALLQASIAAEQMIKADRPPQSGGIMGFEATRGIKRSRSHAVPYSQAPDSNKNTVGTKAETPSFQQNQPDSVQTCQQLGRAKQEKQMLQEQIESRRSHAIAYSQAPESSKNTAHTEAEAQSFQHNQHDNVQTFQQFGRVEPESQSLPQLIEIRVLTANQDQPIVLQEKTGVTPLQILARLREAKVADEYSVMRTGVATHLPLHEPIAQGQLLRVEQMQTEIQPRCNQRSEQGKPQIPFPSTRATALWHQKSWVAQDEFDYYLDVVKTIPNVVTFPSIVVTSDPQSEPLQTVTTWLQQAIYQIEQFDQCAVSAVNWKEHWIPVAIEKQQSGCAVTIPPACWELEQVIYEWAANAEIHIAINYKVVAHQFAGDCGFQSYAWIVSFVNGNAQFNQLESFTPHQAEYCRSAFENHLFATGKAFVIIDHLHLGGTKHEEVKEQLQQVLLQHGVWKERVEERANHLINTIPITSLKNILNSPRSWQDLKQAANACSPPIKLIMSDELQAQIQIRTKTTNRIGNKNKKVSQSHIVPDHIQVEACDVEIPTGVFRQANGPLLGNIDVQNIGPNAAGVVIVDNNQAEAILRLKQPVTQNGLAIIVLANRTSASDHLVPAIRFPAMFKKTQEPIIISGFMYQLGKHQAIRHEPQEKLAIDYVQAEAIRCLVFRDQAGPLWEKMGGHPVRAIFDAEPMLTSKNDEGQNVVIDVWDRQWYSKRFEKTKEQSADLFAFSFRVIATEVDTLLETSGSRGIYFEPRSACGRQPCESYHVTWLPHSTYQEAKYAQQTSPQKTSLVRHGERYGLRSDTMNAKQVHEHHRPDTPFLMGGTKMLYSLGPLPYSTTRESIIKLMKVWQWEGRPLQPRGRSADGSGVNWTIQATSDPSHFVYQLQHGDVLITKTQNRKSEARDSTLNIVASKKTIEQLQKTDTIDTIWHQDPWKQYKPLSTAPVAAPQPAISQAQLAKIEANVARKVQAGLHTREEDIPMPDTQANDRISQLEQQMQNVTGQQKQIEERIGNMQQQLDQQGVQFKQTLEQQLGDQMSRIEALLVKRVRHE